MNRQGDTPSQPARAFYVASAFPGTTLTLTRQAISAALSAEDGPSGVHGL